MAPAALLGSLRRAEDRPRWTLSRQGTAFRGRAARVASAVPRGSTRRRRAGGSRRRKTDESWHVGAGAPRPARMSKERRRMGPRGPDDGGSRLVAVKLRLVRMGKKKQPTYRVVAADSRSPRDGRFLEVLGTYAPRGRSRAEPDTIVTIDHEKVLRWLSQGAQPTERVERLLRASGAWDEFQAAKAK